MIYTVLSGLNLIRKDDIIKSENKRGNMYE